MRLTVLFSTFCLSVLIFGGCSNTASYIPLEQIPASNNDVIKVEKAFDYVYLAVFDAVNELEGWSPSKTLKGEGLIYLQNARFSRLDDSSARAVGVRIQRDSQTQTSVFLEPESRRIIGADEVLAAIRKKLDAV